MIKSEEMFPVTTHTRINFRKHIILQDEGHLSIILQKLDLEIWDQRECYEKWFEEITTK